MSFYHLLNSTGGCYLIENEKLNELKKEAGFNLISHVYTDGGILTKLLSNADTVTILNKYKPDKNKID